MKKSPTSPRPKPYLYQPVSVLSKFKYIGLDPDTMLDLEQKARDDDARPLQKGQLSRVESFCIRRCIVGLTQLAPLFWLAVKMGRNSGKKNQALYDKLEEVGRSLSHTKGQLTAVVTLTPKPAASRRRKR